MAVRIVCMFSFSLCFLHAAFGISTSTICTSNGTTSISATGVTVQSLEECAASKTPTAPYLRCSRTLTSKAHAGTAVLTSSYSCSATAPADLPIFIDASRGGKALASAPAEADGTCHGVTDMTTSPAATQLSSDGNNSCSIVATGIHANTTTSDMQSDTSSHCTITTTTENGTVSSTIACSSVTLTREGLELLSTAVVNNTCTSTVSASNRDPISVSTLCSLSSLVTGRSSLAIHSDTTSNCTTISSTFSGSVSNSVTVCFVDSTEDVLSAAHHVQTTGLSIHRMLAAMP